MTLDSGAYVIPNAATVTVTATLVAAPAVSGAGDPGADAAAATFTPPATVTVEFRHASAGFSSVAPASVWAYRCEVQLLWSGAPAATMADQPSVLIPCNSAPLAFAFSTVLSELFIPSGTASITSCGWALPLVTATVTTLPAAGPGAGHLVLGGGASLETSVQATVAIQGWDLEVSTGALFIIAAGVETLSELNQTVFQLWPLATNPNVNASVTYTTSPLVLYSYYATPYAEIIATMGEVQPNIDRPLTATGSRFAYFSVALLLIEQLKHFTLLAIVGARADNPKVVIPIALENALLGVDAAQGFTLAAELDGGPDATQCKFAAAAFYFNMRWLLPTLPDPYAANFNLSVVETEGRSQSEGTLIGAATWRGAASKPTVGFLLLPAGHSQSAFPTRAASVSDTAVRGPEPGPSGAALLDLSTRVDLFGVAVAPEIGALLDKRDETVLAGYFKNPPQTGKTAPAAAVVGMGLWLNRALVTTFALPQFSWEPMESTAAGQSGPLACEPANDGFPLLITAPNNQQLVPFQPDFVLAENILAVAAGMPFAGVFSLPFGLDAAIVQPNSFVKNGSTFLGAGGRFGLNRPLFPNALPPAPPTATAPATPRRIEHGSEGFSGRAHAVADAGESAEPERDIPRCDPA
jgi:hypothetical protein